MPVLRIVGSLPAPMDKVEKILHTTLWDDQRNQASAFFGFLDGAAPEILRLNEGNQVHVDLVNVSKSIAGAVLLRKSKNSGAWRL